MTDALTKIAARLLRFEDVCEKPHRDGERHPHVHSDVTFGYGQQLAGIAQAERRASAEIVAFQQRVAALEAALREAIRIWDDYGPWEPDEFFAHLDAEREAADTLRALLTSEPAPPVTSSAVPDEPKDR